MNTQTNTNSTTVNKPARKRVQITFQELGRTRQGHKDECDINQILGKFQKTGALTHANNHEANYGFASSLSFTEAMQTVTTARSMFAELPSSLRDKFDHDPAKFLEFVQNPANDAEKHELGLFSTEGAAAYILRKQAAEALSDTPPAIPVIDEDTPLSGETPGD